MDSGNVRKNIMNNIEKVYAAVDSNPALLDALLGKKTEEAPVTRGMPWMEEEKESPVKEILGSQVSEQEVEDVLKELNDNQIVQLYRESEGAIDAKELLDYAGGLNATKAKDSPALRALFDGKLQLKEIILIILLMKLFKKKQQNQYSTYSSGGLLNSLLGTNTQPSITNSLFSGLFGNSGLNSYGTQYYAPQSSNSLLNLFGLGGSTSNYNNSYNSLNSFLSGNGLTGQSQSLFGLLNQNANTGVYSSGQVNVNSLFSILNSLLGGR